MPQLSDAITTYGAALDVTGGTALLQQAREMRELMLLQEGLIWKEPGLEKAHRHRYHKDQLGLRPALQQVDETPSIATVMLAGGAEESEGRRADAGARGARDEHADLGDEGESPLKPVLEVLEV